MYKYNAYTHTHVYTFRGCVYASIFQINLTKVGGAHGGLDSSLFLNAEGALSEEAPVTLAMWKWQGW